MMFVLESTQVTKQCDECSSAPVEYSCEQCEGQLFCAGCDNIVHAPRTLQKHHRHSIDKNIPISRSCPTHRGQKLSHWCLKCDIPVCPLCYMDNHETHGHEHVDKLAAQLVEQVRMNIH